MNTKQSSEEGELRDETGGEKKQEFLTYAKVFKLYNRSIRKSLEDWGRDKCSKNILRFYCVF